jgi:hypothetical protein
MSRTAATQVLRGVRIATMRRLNSRASGSPRWLVCLDDGTEAETGDGAQCSHSIDNAQFRDVPLEVELRGGYIVRVQRYLPVVHIDSGPLGSDAARFSRLWREEGFTVASVPQDQERHPFGRPCRACSPEGTLEGMDLRTLRSERLDPGT